VPGNITNIDRNVIKIMVKPGSDSSPQLLNILSWNVTDFDKNQMKIKIKFENPLSISLATSNMDKLDIEVFDPLFFCTL
jgi:hypothetical protein